MQPQHPTLSPRARQVADAARALLDEAGWEAVTMHALAARVGVRTPSLYKHLASRDALKAVLVADGLAEVGAALHAAVPGGVTGLLGAYRALGTGTPHLYRLCTSGPLPRSDLPEGLEEWAGTPFFLVTGEPHLAQALWSYAHGMVVLEIDGRYPPGSDLDRTWALGAAAFGAAAQDTGGGGQGATRQSTHSR